MKSTLTRIVANKTPMNYHLKIIFVRISCLGKQGEFLVKKLHRKIQWHLTQPVEFVVIYDTMKIYFLPKKDSLGIFRNTLYS